ncbi:hypothetical protein [Paludisphaera mucosa]|uniref:Ammonium transporter AmtB-like domain-containing protein n=1 Tax=Paludisphaera mucosa TaxID=3030827 RepID=A0ABT6F4Z2_9BACT|nr:hypothetical protein [Paludisphaera mucosa]MDG3002470.1 hypothetical protein [Paludisphaera mucosa]
MPDPILMLEALAAALFASALVVAAGRLAGRRWAGVVQAAALALGAYLGLAVLGVTPRWPLREDQDRFLGLVLPAVLLVEAVGGWARIPGRAKLAIRLVASLAVAPVLLYGSSYLTDLGGPGTADWPPAQRYAILGGLGLTLFGVWSGLAWTSRRSASALRAPLALATAIGGASLAVMLSGYASGGMNGVPLAGAVAGASIAAALLKGDDRDALPGVGAVALFSLLLVGYAFGELRPDVATALFLAPMLAAAPEAPPLARSRPWMRTAFALALVGLAAALAVGLTIHRFQAKAAETRPNDGGPTADDYGQFR